MAKSKAPKSTKKSPKTKAVNLAIQGGGAHGAYAWGILDKILEDGRLTIEGICATSAGSVNAIAVAWGLHKGNAQTARDTLHKMWSDISAAGQAFSPIQRTAFDVMSGYGGSWNLDNNLSYTMFDAATRMFSPYQFNPFNFNPLDDIIKNVVDFDELGKCEAVKLFISATNVKTGRVKVFETHEVTSDVIMASACLPFLFQAVEINGDYYWDGGYTGNPALYPLHYATDTNDLIIMHINPLVRPYVPATGTEITNRINEISFNASLIDEIRSIAFVKKLIEQDMLKPGYEKYFKDILLHAIRADKVMSDLSVASKFDTSWNFLTHLRDQGRGAAERWLAKNYDAVGKHDTVDIKDDYLKFGEEDANKQT